MIRSRFVRAVLYVAALSCAEISLADQPQNPPRSRRDFAQAMSQLKKGMPEARVVESLGRPDDIRTEHDPGGISTNKTQEIWRYGTSGHLTPATLGQVFIDKEGHVQYLYGRGTPPPDGMFTEAELRHLITTLAEVPSYNAGSSYNPLKVIRAVNLLQPLGKEKAVAAIQESLRVSARSRDDGSEGTFLVLRTLFDVPADPGYFPRMYVGGESPQPPKDPKSLPRFPVVIVGDVPLMLVSGYFLAGMAEPPEEELDYFRKSGKLRSKLLVPTDKPFRALDDFIKSPQWLFAGPKAQHDKQDEDPRNDPCPEQTERSFLSEQLLRLLDSVDRLEADKHGGLIPYDCDGQGESRRREIVAKAARLNIRWNAKVAKYTFLDGTSLPEVAAKINRREVWLPTVPESTLEFSLERQDPHYVNVSIREHVVSRMALVFKIWDIADKNEPIATIEVGTAERKANPPSSELTITNGTHSSRTSGRKLELADGHQITVELLIEGKSQTSPIFKP